MKIFQDSDCAIELNRVIYEGRLYFLRFPSIDENTVKTALALAGIEEFVSWHPLNPVATLKVVNRIGLLRIFGREYDIRSEKFLETETGQRQFQFLLDDLALLSRHILFAPNAGPSANRISGHELHQPSLLERFNYYRQICFKRNRRPGLVEFVEQIIRNPHGKLVNEHIRDHIWNAKKPSRQTLKSFFQHDQSFARMPLQHPLAKGRPGLKIAGSSDIIFPLKALRSQGSVSVDTAENRFIKHVLLDVENVCHSVIQTELLSGPLLDQCHQLLKLTRSLLRLSFFQDIGRLNAIPYASPTLGRRHGYRDLYRIFMRCRLGARHLFDELVDDDLVVELKDVSLLYEYWVFYKIAFGLLKPNSIYQARSSIVKDGRIINTAAVTDGEWTVHFNRTFTRRPKGSYSLRLRPDIIIERNAGVGVQASLHVLDAKYKSVEYGLDDDEESLFKSIRVVKPADIHKMHCYIDAIEGVQTASAVYPGNKFVFYPRDRSVLPVTSSNEMGVPSGVGAIPLLPGSSDKEFNEFLAVLKNSSAQ